MFCDGTRTRGITVNGVAPGMIDTPMSRRSSRSAGWVKALIITRDDPVRRAGKPDDMANAVVWLCEDAPSYMSGQIIGVNGGRTTEIGVR